MKPLWIKLNAFLALRLTWALVLLLLSQIVFAISNPNLLHFENFANFLWVCLCGLRFALSTFAWLYLPYIFLLILPIPFRTNRYYLVFTDVIYAGISAIILLANSLDAVYYGFTFKRMSADVFSFLSVGGDFTKLIPRFAIDFWPHVLVTLFLFSLIGFGIWAIRCRPEPRETWRSWARKGLYFIVFTGILIVAQRGGLQYRPLEIFHAFGNSAKQADLILNTPFTIMKTIGQESVHETPFFSDQQTLNALYNPLKPPVEAAIGNKTPNIVVIILESFAAEYIGAINKGHKSYTPFLDSLAQQSVVYRGYANGTNSMTGIISIVCGFPSLLTEIFITSQYANNRMESLASIVKPKGYKTYFYHGGYNGTLGLDALCSGLEFDHYYGKNQYDKVHKKASQDYDGHWGIFDHAFLPWAAENLKKTKTPYLAIIYSLSSHHPYTIPKTYKNRFDKGSLPIHESIGYSDHALRLFFEEARKNPSFKNTLFIITADHSAQTENAAFQTPDGSHEIPMFWYYPEYLKPQNVMSPMQHIDILPTLRHFVGSTTPAICFGRDALDPSEMPFFITYSNNTYQLIRGGFLLRFDTQGSWAVSPAETALSKPQTAADSTAQTLFLKAYIQHYNQALIHNKTAYNSHP